MYKYYNTIALNIKLFLSCRTQSFYPSFPQIASKSPFINTSHTSCPFASSSTPSSKSPIYTEFSTKSRTSFKMPKNPPYFLPDHTHSNYQSKMNPLKTKDSYYFPAYPDHILPNSILLNHILTIPFYKLSYNGRLFPCKFRNFLLSHRTIHRVQYLSQKKEATAETVTSHSLSS